MTLSEELSWHGTESAVVTRRGGFVISNPETGEELSPLAVDMDASRVRLQQAWSWTSKRRP